MKFDLINIDVGVCCGCLYFEWGVVEILVFMLVGIYGLVKVVLLKEVVDIGVYIILGNIFYLMLRLGMDIIKLYGDLYDFM